MTIIKFPKSRPHNASIMRTQSAPMGSGRKVFMGLTCAVWAIAALTWPLLSWVAAIDCVFQLLRMLYYWDTPRVHAGITFLAHFLGLCALTFFVFVYRPEWPSDGK